jgi:hypothetical protein
LIILVGIADTLAKHGFSDVAVEHQSGGVAVGSA